MPDAQPSDVRPPETPPPASQAADKPPEKQVAEPKPSESKPPDKPITAQAAGAPSAAAKPAATPFWNAFPTIMTAIAGVIAAVATLLATLDKAALLPGRYAPTAVAVAAVSQVSTTPPAPTLAPTTPVPPSPTVPPPSATPTPLPPTATPAPTTIPTKQRATLVTALKRADEVLLTDDFQSAEEKWSTETREDYETGVLDGEFRILTRETEVFVWSNPIRSYTFGDFRLEVEGRRISGPLESSYGVIVRWQSDQDFYAFVISTDGYYSIKMQVDDEWSSLVEWTQTDAVRQGEATNRLRVECVGARMRFYVNDELVREVEDHTFASGNIGLIIGSTDTEGTEARFDNLKVETLKKF